MCVDVNTNLYKPGYFAGSRTYGIPEMFSMAKAVGKKGGRHVSSQKDFGWELGQTAVDPFAVWGDHDRGLNMVPSSYAKAGHVDSYGSHVLALMVPNGHIWTGDHGRPNYCFLGDEALVVWCYACNDGIAPPEEISKSLLQLKLGLGLPDVQMDSWDYEGRLALPQRQLPAHLFEPFRRN